MQIKSFTSHDDKLIYYYEWDNVENPKAVIHLVHGMAENIFRYDDFAKFLNKHGYIVYGMDLRGHGETGKADDKYGYFAKEDGWNVLIEDLRSLLNVKKNKYPTLKFFMLGHSMGSFLTRDFLNRYDYMLNGSIVMGTGSAEYTKDKKFLIFLTKFFNPEKRANFLHKMAFTSFNKAFEPAKTEFDWLTRDEAEVQKYMDNEFCGFVPTNEFYRDLVLGLKALDEKEKKLDIDPSYPILFISGDKDPVGSAGKDVLKIYDSYKNQGMKNICIKLYPDMRHEIVNELDNHLVYQDVLEWLDNTMEG